MSSSQTYSPFRSVLLREWRRMTSRRLYSVCVYHPAAIYPFLHGNNLRQRADGKHSHRYCRSGQYCSSRAITRNISAVPTFKVTRHFVNEEAARKAVQKRKFMVISPFLPNLSKMLFRERMRLSPIIIIMRCFRSVAN